MSYTIEEISRIIKAQVVGNAPNVTILRLLTDSRSLTFPDETLFFAIVTRHGDGHNYIDELYKKGVRNFVVNAAFDSSIYADANFLVVNETLESLQMLAAHHRQRFNIPIVGITGSDGKTIVKEWLYQITADNFVATRSPRSYNSQIGVPLSVWMLNANSTLGIFEAGISQPREMDNLEKIIRPTIGIITNISEAHQENFSSIQDKCAEKLSLFKECDIIIYNGDNRVLSDCVGRTLFTSREIAWSCKDPERPLFISAIKKEADCTTISYRYLTFENSYSIPFVDDASIEDSINCLAAALYLMIPGEVIARRMAALEPVAMRLEVKEGINGCILINDNSNSDTASLDIALDFMERRCSTMTQKKNTLILSDLKETGQSTRSLYRIVARYIEKRSIDKLIGIGKDIASEAATFAKAGFESHFFATAEEFMTSECFAALHDEVILIKGSPIFRFEKISEALEKKVHQTILEVNLSALRENLNHYRNYLKPDTKIICMVKASAYGAGALEVARTLQESHVNYLAVAVVDEGVELRKAGLTTGIIIMNPEPCSFRSLFANKLEPEVYNFSMLKALIQAATREGITDYPVHIKIDTGMNRLGFFPEEVPALVEELKKQCALTPRSIFSHFAGSDSEQLDYFTRLQSERFNAAADTLQQAFPHHILQHICNSAAIERFPQEHRDMVRLGIGLYGISPIGEDANLQPVATLKTIILHLHDVPAEESVGYSRRGTLTRTSRIAALPIGYADGLNRKLGNRHGYCLVNGKPAQYVGNICMDVCMIDVTGIDCKEGDTVEIFGSNLPLYTVAEWLETIPYEVLTSVSERIKRVYYCD